MKLKIPIKFSLKKSRRNIVSRTINDVVESGDIKDILEQNLGKNQADKFQIVVDDKKGVHKYCPFGYDLDLDQKNKIIHFERYDNFEKSYASLQDEIVGLLDGSIEVVSETNLSNLLYLEFTNGRKKRKV